MNNIFIKPASAPLTGALTANTSTGEIVMTTDRKFMFVSAVAVNIAFGNAGMNAATTSDVLVPANTPMFFELSHFDRVRLISASAGTYCILPLEG